MSLWRASRARTLTLLETDGAHASLKTTQYSSASSESNSIEDDALIGTGSGVDGTLASSSEGWAVVSTDCLGTEAEASLAALRRSRAPWVASTRSRSLRGWASAKSRC